MRQLLTPLTLPHPQFGRQGLEQVSSHRYPLPASQQQHSGSTSAGPGSSGLLLPPGAAGSRPPSNPTDSGERGSGALHLNDAERRGSGRPFTTAELEGFMSDWEIPPEGG